jgi:hypothetical protein
MPSIRPSPLSRQVSSEPDRQSEQPVIQTQHRDRERDREEGPIERNILSRTSSSAASNRTRVNARSRVLITSSDPRGYPALRRALDIKHIQVKNGNGGESSDSDYPLSPVVIQKPLPLQEGESQQEEERGRPRSKESQKSLVMLEAIHRNRAEDGNREIVESKDINEVGIETVQDKEERKASRNRKMKSKTGFWSLFAGESNGHGGNHRSFSMPPSRDALV